MGDGRNQERESIMKMQKMYNEEKPGILSKLKIVSHIIEFEMKTNQMAHLKNTEMSSKTKILSVMEDGKNFTGIMPLYNVASSRKKNNFMSLKTYFLKYYLA